MMSHATARIIVEGAGSAIIVNGIYSLRDAATVPSAFALVCTSSGWDAASTWKRLNGEGKWWEAPNKSYFYFNSDGQWWLDSGVTGLGLYVSRAAGAGAVPPREGWAVLGEGVLPLPRISVDVLEVKAAGPL